MTDIKEAKDAVAKKYNYENWEKMQDHQLADYYRTGKLMVFDFSKYINEAIQLYHSMMCEEAGRELNKFKITYRDENFVVKFDEASLIISSLTSQLEDANKEIERFKGIIELKDL